MPDRKSTRTQCLQKKINGRTKQIQKFGSNSFRKCDNQKLKAEERGSAEAACVSNAIQP
jgi:predicted transcriptional regulator